MNETQLAFSTNAFKKNTLDEAIDVIGEIGYAGVEIMADVPHAYPPRLPVDQLAALKSRIAAPGMSVSNINAFTLFACGDTYHPTWIEDDVQARERRISHTLAAIDLAAQVGAKTVSLQPGGPMIGTDLTRDLAGERFAEGLARVLPAARRQGIVLAIEPEPGLFIQTSGEYREFKDRFFRDDASIQMNCDIGHLFCVGDDPVEVIRTMSDHLAHVHLEDIGANRVHQHLTPGKGVIDFPSVFAALKQVKYPGWVTVELYPYEVAAAGVARRAFDHLQPMLG